MLTNTNDGRFRISSSILKDAGFRAGNRVSVVRESRNSFSIVPTQSVPTGVNRVDYRVEKDGRARIALSAINTIGVRSRRKQAALEVSPKRVRVII